MLDLIFQVVFEEASISVNILNVHVLNVFLNLSIL